MWLMEKVKKIVRRHEELDPTPLSIPLKFKRETSLEEKVADLLRSQQWAQYCKMRGMETFEEANDFDIDGDDDPSSPYELEGVGYEKEFDAFVKKTVPKINAAKKAQALKQKEAGEPAPKEPGSPPASGPANAATVPTT